MKSIRILFLLALGFISTISSYVAPVPAAHAQAACPSLPLVTVNGVTNSNASMAKLIPDAAASFQEIRDIVRTRTGVDALGRTSDMLRSPFFRPSGPGSIDRSWHKTGRAVDLSTPSLFNLPTSGPFIVTPQGSMFRITATGPAGSVDVTALFEARGWNRIPQQGAVLEWWHYEYHPGGLDWYTAMRQVWPLDTLQAAFPTIDWTRVNCIGLVGPPPILTPTPGGGGGWGYLGPTPRTYYVLPAGDKNSCYAPEWPLVGANVIFDPNTCQRGEELVPGGDIRCDECKRSVPPPVAVPLYPRRPTNQDLGQKDGTGMSGDNRSYRYYDYDTGQYVEVPPLPFGTLGGYNVVILPQPPVDPDATPTTAPVPTLAPVVPCGWPNDSSTSRTISSGCASPLSNPGHCPRDASFCANGVTNSLNQQQVDIDGAFPVYSTLRGTAYRCINETTTTDFESLGVYVIVIGANGTYQTVNAHLGTHLPEDGLATSRPADTPCFNQDVEVKRFAVNPGDYIGVVGLTGNTNRAHLEYEIWQGGNRVCPATFMDFTNPACSSIASAPAPLAEVPSNLFMSLIRQLSPIRL